MGKTPKTSTTLLKQIAGAAEHPRWEEFVAKYRPALEAFARERFPGLEADDLIQETLLALMRALPDYVAREDKKGAFHNYLTGVLRHKAVDALRKAGHRAEAEALAAREAAEAGGGDWRRTLYAVALGQLMDNPRLGARSKQIFLRLALRGETPREVAESLQVSRAFVDQTKKRMMARLKQIIEGLGNADS